MKKTIVLLTVLFSICCFDSFGIKITRTEMLGRPTNNGISVKAIFDAVVQTRVCYGISSGVYQGYSPWLTVSQDSSGDAVSITNLTNLAPDTKYFYKLQYRNPTDTTIISRPEHSFHTSRVPGEPFTFVIQADPHLDAASDTALYRVCLQNQLADNPDFMIDLGDFLMTDKLKNSHNIVPEDTVPFRCNLLRSFYETINHSVPLFNVLGNHEGEEGWYLDGTANNIAIWDTNYRKKYFMNPESDSFYTGDTTNYKYIGLRDAYFAWKWGDAQFVVLDPFWNTNPKPDSLDCWRWTLGKLQYDWLKTTLENSTAKYKFVFLHNLVGGNGDGEGRGGVETANNYEWGGNNIDGTNGWAVHRPGWYKPIKDLLEENKVTIVFHGHDHFFAKQELDCLLYQEVPQPSLPNFRSVPQAAQYGYVSGIILQNSGHLRLNVSSAGVTVDYVRAARTSQETSTLHNRDVSETYFVNTSCYDSLQSSVPAVYENYNIIAAYPNPTTNNSLVIQAETAKNYDRQIALTNIKGETVARGELKKEDTQTQLNITDVVSGIYFVNVFDGPNSSSFKIIVSK